MGLLGDDSSSLLGQDQQKQNSDPFGFSNFLTALVSSQGVNGSGIGFSNPLSFGGVAAGAATGAQQASGFSKLAQGKNPSGLEHAALFPITGGFDTLAPVANKVFGGGKDAGQREREQATAALKNSGLVDADNKLRFADGTEFDFGGEHDQETGERLYELDNNDPTNASLIGLVNPFSYLLSQGDDKSKVPQLTAKLVRAIRKSTNPAAAAREIYSRAGLDYRKAVNGLVELRARGKIDYPTFAALKNGAKQTFGETK